MTPASPFANALAKHKLAPKPKTHAKITVTKIAPPVEIHRYHSAGLIIKDGFVFILSNGKSETGLRFSVDPVFTSLLLAEDVVKNVKKVVNSDYEKVTKEQVDKLLKAKTPKDSPTLRATHSSSWRNLGKTAVSYSIQPIDGETKWALFLHNPKRNYLSSDDMLEFPISTPLEELVKIILEDVKKYPHVLGKDAPASTQ